MAPVLTHEVRYRLLEYLDRHPDTTQRELATQLGVSVGKINYCLSAVIAKGWVKMRNFRTSKQKSAYLYVLTPKGVEEKVKTTKSFLRRKVAEYDLLKKEIEKLVAEVEKLGIELPPDHPR